ncbi:MAG: hypothetical protein JWP29_3762 [Rhodoferax sp.]|nr:hypothetical protein [Rhodoferax sp.]
MLLHSSARPAAPLASGSGRLEWLQAARGGAALLVLMFHLRPLIAGAPAIAPSAVLWTYGFCGVDIFFVISGFVVARSLQSLAPTAHVGGLFVAKRLLRIFSGYWPALALTVVVTMWLPGNENFPPMAKMWDSLFLLSPSLFDHWLGTAWSLSYELYFYGCLAVLFFAVRWGTFYQRLVFAMAVLLVVNAACYVVDREMVETGHQPMRHWFAGFGIEFLAGSCLAELLKHRPVISKKLIPVFAIFGLLGLLMGTSSYHFANVEVLRAGSYGLFGLGVVLIALTLDSHALRAPAWLVKLGDSSFSLYLLHPLLIGIYGWLQFRLMPSGPYWVLAFTLSAVPVMLLVCHGWYLAVERPLHRLAERVIGLERQKAVPATHANASRVAVD